MHPRRNWRWQGRTGIRLALLTASIFLTSMLIVLMAPFVTELLGIGGAGGASTAVQPPETAVMFQHGIRRPGFLDVSAPASVRLAWHVDGVNKWTHTAAKSSPVLYNSTIIVGGDTGTVYAFDMDGDVEWLKATRPSENGVHSTATVHNGTAYIGAYDGAVYAYDVATGALQWRTAVGDAIGSSPAYYNGNIYVSVETNAPSGIMAILDAETGKVQWTDRRITDHPHSSVAIAPQEGVFVVGANDGRLYAWNLTTRRFLWHVETDGAIKGPILVHDGNAVFGSWDHHVYSVDLDNGTVDWRYETWNMVMAGAAAEPGTDTIYIGSHDTGLYALDAATGEQRWRFDTDGWITGSPVVTRNAVLVGSKDDHLYAVNRSNGEELWRYETSGDVTASPYMTRNGAVLFTNRATDDEPGGLYLLRPATYP